MRFEVTNPAEPVILRTFHGLADGPVPSGNQADEGAVHPEGGRDLTGIEDAQAAAGARSEVKHASAFGHALGHGGDGFGYRWP